jgi:hypothetical protein
MRRDTQASAAQEWPTHQPPWQPDKSRHDFVKFARTEGRFAKHFDKDGIPSAELLKAQDDRLKN